MFYNTNIPEPGPQMFRKNISAPTIPGNVGISASLSEST